jgi:hypothetical protein
VTAPPRAVGVSGSKTITMTVARPGLERGGIAEDAGALRAPDGCGGAGVTATAVATRGPATGAHVDAGP